MILKALRTRINQNPGLDTNTMDEKLILTVKKISYLRVIVSNFQRTERWTTSVIRGSSRSIVLVVQEIVIDDI